MNDLLKYATDPVAFIDDLVQKNELGQPFRLLDHQREILRLAFAFDKDGRLPWDTLIWSCIKKDGKSFINALMVICWAFTQEAPNEIDIRSNDKEQSQNRVLRMVVGLLRQNPLLGRSANILTDRVSLSNGTVIRALAQDWKGESGGNQGFTSWDEAWAFTNENARRAWDEAPPVPTRRNSIRFVTTYAGIDGESDLLKEQYLLGVGREEHPDGQGERIHPDLPVYANHEARVFCYWDHHPQAPWQTQQYLDARKQELRSRPNTWMRQYENRWTAAESSLITPEMYDACVEPTWEPADPDPELAVWVGFDASTIDDYTACMVITRDENTFVLLDHRIWRPSRAHPMDLEATLEAYIRDVNRRFRLVVVYGDPYQAHRSITTLEKDPDFGERRIKKFHQTEGNTTKMADTLYSLFHNRRLVIYPNPDLRQQAMNTLRIEGARGTQIGKASASRKVDAMVALSIACIAAVEVPVRPAFQILV